jgi:hypothetical protein
MAYYLDNFIFILQPGIAAALVITIYNRILASLGFPGNALKDIYGIISNILSYKVNTISLIISLSKIK